MSMNCCGGRLTWCTIARRAGVRRACARPRWQPRRGVPPRSRNATPPPYCDVSHGERASRQYMREQARMQACLCARAERRDLARSNARELCLADQLRTVTNHAAVADLRDAWQSWRREVTLLALEANVKRIVGRNLRCGAHAITTAATGRCQRLDPGPQLSPRYPDALPAFIAATGRFDWSDPFVRPSPARACASAARARARARPGARAPWSPSVRFFVTFPAARSCVRALADTTVRRAARPGSRAQGEKPWRGAA